MVSWQLSAGVQWSLRELGQPLVFLSSLFALQFFLLLGPQSIFNDTGEKSCGTTSFGAFWHDSCIFNYLCWLQALALISFTLGSCRCDDLLNSAYSCQQTPVWTVCLHLRFVPSSITVKPFNTKLMLTFVLPKVGMLEIDSCICIFEYLNFALIYS